LLEKRELFLNRVTFYLPSVLSILYINDNNQTRVFVWNIQSYTWRISCITLLLKEKSKKFLLLSC